MTDDLVRKVQFGDITFGVPKDIALLDKPWGFYEFLGIPKTATREDIKKAYRSRSLELHPDRGGDPEQFNALARVYDILFDDGGELGPQHSQRTQYDRVSTLDELFDGFIEKDGERTKKLSEIILTQMEAERKYAEAEHELTQKSLKFAGLKEKLERAISDASKEKIAKEMQEAVAEANGIDAKAQEEIQKVIEERRTRIRLQQESFRHDFARNLHKYFAKILDALYCGGDITFGTGINNMRIGMAGHDVKDHILFLLLGGPCYIVGFQRVHFKAEEANVNITDQNLTGIFHVVKGNVSVDYEGSSYGGVIRARAPQVRMIRGFEQKGDLYVPSRFATQNWWKKKPALDLAVHEGRIDLNLRQQEFLYGLNLESLIDNTYSDLEKYMKNTNSIIKSQYIIKKNFYDS